MTHVPRQDLAWRAVQGQLPLPTRKVILLITMDGSAQETLLGFALMNGRCIVIASSSTSIIAGSTRRMQIGAKRTRSTFLPPIDIHVCLWFETSKSSEDNACELNSKKSEVL